MTIPEPMFRLLVPVVWLWARWQERRILRSGVVLNEGQRHDAMAAGVSHAERVRLLKVSQIGAPRHAFWRAIARRVGLFFPSTAGMTLGYGILIREDCWSDRRLLVHELAHVAQYEDLGFVPFLRQYLRECLTVGYEASPMEREVERITDGICGPIRSEAPH